MISVPIASFHAAYLRHYSNIRDIINQATLRIVRSECSLDFASHDGSNDPLTTDIAKMPEEGILMSSSTNENRATYVLQPGLVHLRTSIDQEMNMRA